MIVAPSFSGVMQLKYLECFILKKIKLLSFEMLLLVAQRYNVNSQKTCFPKSWSFPSIEDKKTHGKKLQPVLPEESATGVANLFK